MNHTKTPWTWINADHKKSRLGHLFGDGDMILDTPDFIYGESVNAAFIVKACNNHENLLLALKNAREAIAGYPRSLAYDITHLPMIDAAIKAAQDD